MTTIGYEGPKSNLSISSPGWYLLSTTVAMSWEYAKTYWNIPNAQTYRYIYELKNAPVSEDTILTVDSWIQHDTTAQGFRVSATKSYFVKVISMNAT